MVYFVVEKISNFTKCCNSPSVIKQLLLRELWKDYELLKNIKKENCVFRGQLWELNIGIKFLLTIFLLIYNYFIKKYSTSDKPCAPNFYVLCQEEVCRIA